MNDIQSRTELAPVVKSLLVALPPERAFELFTAGIDRWWPRATHSISQARAAQVVFEGRLAGSIHELRDDGVRFEWGKVEDWSPPVRVAFTWHPGRESSTAQRVAVTFVAEGSGTRVTLTHSGWEALGDQARKSREDYDGGWDLVFTRCYGDACR